MISKQSEQFLIELRMYLISKGKNDEEINQITEELEDHLLEAEAAGKDIKHIIGESPKQYMKSIGKSMDTDFRELAGLIPLLIVLLAAYLGFVPALSGEFAVSAIIIVIAVVAALVCMSIYTLFLYKGLPKLFHKKWAFIVAVSLTNIIVTGLGVLLLLWYQEQNFEATFVATPFQNHIIAAVCVLIFIGAAFYTKTWFTIIIPLIIAIGPITNRFIPSEINEDPMYIAITIILIAAITAFVIFIMVRKRKKSVDQ
ncbi:hypothetical protein [Radiobacillus sp. PE A8.2]|uniref:hypothetical protein n=1 Tax=Radiobacillus sp. PE A8.2 TaxID=3380349 RepID=UPI00388CFBD6